MTTRLKVAKKILRYIKDLISVLGRDGRRTNLDFYKAVAKSNLEEMHALLKGIAGAELKLHFFDQMIGLIKARVAPYPIYGKGRKKSMQVTGFQKKPSTLSPFSTILSKGPSWSVPTGRRDGRVSSKSEAQNLPSPLESIAVHKKKFAEKGLDEQDLLTLLGAHTIGQTDCLFFRYRLRNFTTTGNSDPTINPSFLTELKALCPKDGDATKRVALDKDSQFKFDLSFFNNIKDGNGVLESDQRLWNDDSTRSIIQKYISPLKGLLGLRFEYNFRKSMIKMSSIEVKTGMQGEIRRKCSRFN
ncbi:peroxidase 25-like [Cucumis melo var. makuwa]|uniref:Peroxidase n=1 Tax=Cucumis melo var. makuwa TaxID=1194695 RepID=A0A5D3DT95_CUCMM|nr:peroxidase 25-like [Cucumis melo var. makuwa]